MLTKGKIIRAKIVKKNPIFIPGATVAVQWEDGGLWTYGLIVEPNNDDHRGFSYNI